MGRTWIILAAIALVGGLAGVAIGGRSERGETLMLEPVTASAPTSPPATTTAPATNPPATNPPATTAPVTTGVTVTPPPTTSSSTTDATPTTAEVTTTGLDTQTSTIVADQLLPRDQVRLVVANGDGRYDLVGSNAARLFAAGYVTIDQTDTARVPATVLYFRPGFDDEAAIVAADIGVPGALLKPLPDTPVTINDGLGDIIVVLGPDALR